MKRKTRCKLISIWFALLFCSVPSFSSSWLEGKLAFVKKGPLKGICVLEQGKVREIFSTGADIERVSWSPDGEEIVFNLLEFNEKSICVKSTIYIISSRGGAPRKLEIEEGNYKFRTLHLPDWSPKGDEIAFLGFFETKSGVKNEIFTVKISGKGLKEITHDRVTPGIRYLSWAPDGRRIAFDRGSWDEMNQDLFIVDVISGEVERLTQTRGISEYSPSFSPDGRRIAYVTLSNGLFIMDLESRDHIRIPLPGQLDVRDSRITWSMNGDQIVFNAGGDLYLYDLKSQKFRKLSVDIPGAKGCPDWWSGYAAVRPLNLLYTLWSLIKVNRVKP